MKPDREQMIEWLVMYSKYYRSELIEMPDWNIERLYREMTITYSFENYPAGSPPRVCISCDQPATTLMRMGKLPLYLCDKHAREERERVNNLASR